MHRYTKATWRSEGYTKATWRSEGYTGTLRDTRRSEGYTGTLRDTQAYGTVKQKVLLHGTRIQPQHENNVFCICLVDIP